MVSRPDVPAKAGTQTSATPEFGSDGDTLPEFSDGRAAARWTPACGLVIKVKRLRVELAREVLDLRLVQQMGATEEVLADMQVV